MTQNLIPLAFEGKAVRTILSETGEPLFVGKDVCDVLLYADSVNALKAHCRGVAIYHPIFDALGREQETRMLTLPDVLRLITSSRMPAAEKFETWVFEDVLPTILKTGQYAVKPAAESDFDFEKLVDACVSRICINSVATEITDPRNGNVFTLTFTDVAKSVLNHGERLKGVSDFTLAADEQINDLYLKLASTESVKSRVDQMAPTLVTHDRALVAIRRRLSALEKTLLGAESTDKG